MLDLAYKAFFWGAVSGSALVFGALVGYYFNISKKVIGWVMAFGAGVLISVIAFELLEKAVDMGIFVMDISIGFLLGAIVFYLGDKGLDYFQSPSVEAQANAVAPADQKKKIIVDY